MTALADLTDTELLAAIDAADPLPPAVLAAARAACRIPALSERHPWGGLIAAGFKPTENRTWATNYRGPILIHSSAGKGDTRPLPTRPDGYAYDVPGRLRVRGHILALATLTDCHRADGCCAPWGETGDRVWHWTLADVQALPEPIPAKGRLGLWKPAPALVSQVLRQLREASDVD